MSERRTPRGDTVFVWDLRFGQPNVSHAAMPAIHSLEHFLGAHFRNVRTGVTNVGVMGCQTGFYINAIGIGEFAEMSTLISDALSLIPGAQSVPLSNSTECGWAENHSLVGAQELAAWLLRRKHEWSDPGTEAEVGS